MALHPALRSNGIIIETLPARIVPPAADSGYSDSRMTTDLRSTVGRIASDLLIVAAGKAFAANANGVDAVKRAHESQVPSVPRHTVIVAERALHFVMLDDPAFLLSPMDAFFSGSARR